MAEINVVSPEDEQYPKDRLATWFPVLPALHTLGNLDLLRLPLTALFCSRKCPGAAILKAYDLARELREKQIPVISGFHTPVEKDMLEILVKGKGPLVICPARGLEGMRLTPRIKNRIDGGSLLLLSMFGKNEKRINREYCDSRNKMVAALGTKAIFVYLDPRGNLLPLSAQCKGVQIKPIE